MQELIVDRAAIGYSNALIIEELSLSIPKNMITTIIGLMVVGNQRY